MPSPVKISFDITEVYKDLLQPSTKLLGEQLRDLVARKIQKKEMENLVPPNVKVLRIIAKNLAIGGDEDYIRNMYANLIISSMTNNSLIHPAFTEIIHQLTPDEARILNWVHLHAKNPILKAETEYALDLPDFSDQYNKIAHEVTLECSDDIEVYFDNLIRLKILSEYQGQESEYRKGGHDRYGEYGPSIISTVRHEVLLTNFGAKFIEACIAE